MNNKTIPILSGEALETAGSAYRLESQNDKGIGAGCLAKVTAMRMECQGILLVELRPVEDPILPAASAGAHIQLNLPGGVSRSYSLVNPPGETHRYVIAVNRDVASKGGSSFIHEKLRVGDSLEIGFPRNHFPLNEDANHSIFIAGGIGITPLWSMIQRLSSLGKSWELHYGAKSENCAAFQEKLTGLPAPQVHFYFASSGERLDIPEIVAKAAPDTHLYCCGPARMIEEFNQTCLDRAQETVHSEVFTGITVVLKNAAFNVVLAKSGLKVPVETGQTILDALERAGCNVPHSCLQGVCGTCEVRVLGGIPEHHDLVLSPSEKSANNVMMVCCSGSKSEVLTLAL